jgi:hypothetical protein
MEPSWMKWLRENAPAEISREVFDSLRHEQAWRDAEIDRLRTKAAEYAMEISSQFLAKCFGSAPAMESVAAAELITRNAAFEKDVAMLRASLSEACDLLAAYVCTCGAEDVCPECQSRADFRHRALWVLAEEGQA